eukprot:1643624-Karenia_brevis.AAC.1
MIGVGVGKWRGGKVGVGKCPVGVGQVWQCPGGGHQVGSARLGRFPDMLSERTRKLSRKASGKNPKGSWNHEAR